MLELLYRALTFEEAHASILNRRINMKSTIQIEITDKEVQELARALMILGDSPLIAKKINWEIIARLLAKIDRAILEEGLK